MLRNPAYHAELEKLIAAGLSEVDRPRVWKLLLGVVLPSSSGSAELFEPERLRQYRSFVADTVAASSSHIADADRLAHSGAATDDAAADPLEARQRVPAPSPVGGVSVVPHHVVARSPLEAEAADLAAASSASSASHSTPTPPHASPTLRLAAWLPPDTLEQINRDLSRCHRDLHFFYSEAHTAAMRRILLTYVRLNTGIEYVQGMHEILAPLYYVMATGDALRRRESARALSNSLDAEALLADLAAAEEEVSGGGGIEPSDSPLAGISQAEAEAYFCFTSLMLEVRELFIQGSDRDSQGGGVTATLTRFAAMLRRREPAVAAHLDELGVAPFMYAFRWVSCLLTLEFPLPDCISLWDAVLADTRRSELHVLLCTCVGMLRLVRRRLLASDFAAALKTLQSYPPCDLLALQQAVAAVRQEERGDAATATAAAQQQRHSLPGATTATLRSGAAAVSSRAAPVARVVSGTWAAILSAATSSRSSPTSSSS